LGGDEVSLFQRRHYKRIVEIAVKMDLEDFQFEALVRGMYGTNYNFNENTFRNYYSSLRGVQQS
jgi:hypothetical protein